MLRNAMLMTGVFVLTAGCASQPPPRAEAPPEPTIVEAEPAPPPPPPAPARPEQGDGSFRVSVASVETAEAAAPWMQKLEAAGYRTGIWPVELEGKTWYRVLAPGYATLEDARAAVPFLEQDLGVQGVWVTSRRRAPGPDAAEPAAEAGSEPEPTPAD